MSRATWRDPNTTDLAVIARWAMAQGWPGRPKGTLLDEAEFRAIVHLPRKITVQPAPVSA